MDSSKGLRSYFDGAAEMLRCFHRYMSTSGSILAPVYRFPFSQFKLDRLHNVRLGYFDLLVATLYLIIYFISLLFF